MSSQTRVFSETSLTFLLQIGNSLDIRNGCRTVSFRSVSSVDSDETIDIPDLLNSVESLQFCGFDTEPAQQIYERWSESQATLNEGQPGYGQEIVEVARQYISGMARVENAYLEDDNWDHALRSQGIKAATRARILDPNYKTLRLSASASEWALDTLNLSWDYLDGLDSRLKRIKKEQDLRSPSPDSSIKPSKAVKPSSTLASAAHGGSSSFKLALEVAPPTQLPERSIFYKGGGWTRLISIFQPDGALDLTEIVSTPPCDFHPTALDLYFTKQPDVAREYASFANARVPPEAPTVLTVAVPGNFMSGAREIFGTDWRRLIWYSRNRRALIQAGGVLPSELKEYEGAEVLVGDICYQSNDQVDKLKTWDELGVMRTKLGNKGSQICLKGPGMMERFRKECRGYVWVATVDQPSKAKYFPPPTA